MKRNTIYKIIYFIIPLFLVQMATAQPGDRSFSVLTFDHFGYVGCLHTNYKFFACSVDYPNALLRSDSMELIWKPDLKSLKILEALQCVEHKNDSIGLSYESWFQASSCLNTHVLMIIRNDKDTMFINAGGSDPYSWILSPNGHELGLPFVFPFQKGLFYLQKLRSERSSVILFYQFIGMIYWLIIRY